jgi:hypothetical protein
MLDKRRRRGLKSPVDVKAGKSYLVPCVRRSNGSILPVMLPAHVDGSDHCLKQTESHYHIDFRFCDQQNGYNAWFENTCSEPFLNKMVAIRDSANSFEAIGGSAFFFVNRWYLRHKDKLAKNRICPHQGVRITNACGECPAHGLKWDLKTNRLADFQPPFFLELANKEVQDEENPRGEIIDDRCVIEINKDFYSDGTVIMVDSNHKRYGTMKQMIQPRNIWAGGAITFDTKNLCK